MQNISEKTLIENKLKKKKKQLFNYFHLKGQVFNDLANDQNLPLPKVLHTCVTRDFLEAKFPFFNVCEPREMEHLPSSKDTLKP